MEWINKPQNSLIDSEHLCFIVWCSSEHVKPICSGYVNPCPTDTSACRKGNML